MRRALLIAALASCTSPTYTTTHGIAVHCESQCFEKLDVEALTETFILVSPEPRKARAYIKNGVTFLVHPEPWETNTSVQKWTVYVPPSGRTAEVAYLPGVCVVKSGITTALSALVLRDVYGKFDTMFLDSRFFPVGCLRTGDVPYPPNEVQRCMKNSVLYRVLKINEIALCTEGPMRQRVIELQELPPSSDK
jgi:hypothetical protein